MNKIQLKIKIIVGSTRQSRFSDKPAHYIFSELQKIEKIEAEILDLRDYPMPFFDSPLSPIRGNGTYENNFVQKWADKINEADALIIVTPEYNHGYPAVLQNAMDVIYHEWNNKPVGFVSYGINGGANVIAQLTPVAVELKMFPISRSIHVPADILLKSMRGETIDLQTFEPLRNGQRGDVLGMFFNELIRISSTLKMEYRNNTI